MSQLHRFGPKWLPRWHRFFQRRVKPHVRPENNSIYRLNFQPLELRESAGFTWFQAALPALGAGAAFLAWTAAEQCCEAATPSAPSNTVVINSADDSILSVPTTPRGSQSETADEQFYFSARTSDQVGNESLLFDSEEDLPTDVVHGVNVDPTMGGGLGEVEMPGNHLSDAAPAIAFVGDPINGSLDSAGTGTAHEKAAASDSNSTASTPSSPLSSSSTTAGLSNSGNSSSQASIEGNGANSAAATSAAEANLAAAPVAFEQNVGQFDPAVKYTVHGSGYELFLTDTQAVFSLQESSPATAAASSAATSPQIPGANAAPEFDVVRMGFVGANATTPQASGQMAEVTNYDVGKDPSQWRTGIANFSSVEYPNIYPGIDLVFQPDSQNASQPEFHFILHPGANPEQIHLSFQGASNIALDSVGDLVVTTQGSKLVEQTPTIYQTNAVGARTTVPGSYVIESDGTVGFSVGKFDTSKALVIDPTIEMARNIGDSSDTQTETGVAIYSSGDAAISGYTQGSDFPVDNAAQSSLAGYEDATFVKLDSSGNILIATYLGGSEVFDDGDGGSEGSAVTYGTAIAVGPNDTAYMVGATDCDDFPVTSNAYQGSAYGPDWQSFLTVFDSSGEMQYSTYYSQRNAGDIHGYIDPINGEHFFDYKWWVTEDVSSGVTVDSNGTAYVSGWTYGILIVETSPPPPSEPQGDPKHVTDSFAYAMTPPASATSDPTLNWADWQIAGNSCGAAFGIALSSDQSSVYLVGRTASTSDFPVTSGAYQTTMGGSTYSGTYYNAYILQLDTATGDVDAGTYLGGSAQDQANGVAVDSSGNVYVTGQTYSSDFPTVSPVQSALGSSGLSTFVSEFNSSLSSLSYSTYFGGDFGNWGNGIAVDSSGNMTITGATLPTDWVTLVNDFSDEGTAYMAQLSADGSTINYSTMLGNGSVSGLAVAVDSSGNAWGVGYTDSGLPSGEITYSGSNPGSGYVIVLGSS